MTADELAGLRPGDRVYRVSDMVGLRLVDDEFLAVCPNSGEIKVRESTTSHPVWFFAGYVQHIYHRTPAAAFAAAEAALDDRRKRLAAEARRHGVAVGGENGGAP